MKLIETRSSKQHSFYAHGKFLLSAEYFVLDGAVALALPLRLGQSMHVLPRKDNQINWQSFTVTKACWFSASFELPHFKIQNTDNKEVAARLKAMLEKAKMLNPGFFQQDAGFDVSTHLEFPRAWGLGSSSTLIYNLATWAGIDAYKLLFGTMGGSGYDLACAGAEGPGFYSLENEQPSWKPCLFNPDFSEQLYFVYLGKKQNSREGVALYKSKRANLLDCIDRFSTLTTKLASSKDLAFFEKTLLEHELLVAEKLGLPRAQDLYFFDYWGVIKSLGAWGGDFVLATSNKSVEATRNYFEDKGHDVFFRYDELVYGEAFNVK